MSMNDDGDRAYEADVDKRLAGVTDDDYWTPDPTWLEVIRRQEEQRERTRRSRSHKRADKARRQA